MSDDRILSCAEVMAKTGLSRTTLWRATRVENGGFPRPIRLSANRVGWSSRALDQWIALATAAANGARAP